LLGLGVEQTCSLKALRVHRRAVVEMAQLVQVDRPILDLEYLREALLIRKALDQLELAALEARLRRTALAGVLALLAAARRLDPAGAVAASEAPLVFPFRDRQILEFHLYSSEAASASALGLRARAGRLGASSVLATASSSFGAAAAARRA